MILSCKKFMSMVGESMALMVKNGMTIQGWVALHNFFYFCFGPPCIKPWILSTKNGLPTFRNKTCPSYLLLKGRNQQVQGVQDQTSLKEKSD